MRVLPNAERAPPTVAHVEPSSLPASLRSAEEREAADLDRSGRSAFDTRPWNAPHLVACLLVAATAVLLSFGALVTTYEAAMAVPDWPGTYGHNMFLFPLAEWLFGPWDLFLEHGHRLLGATVGMITLVLAGLVWRRGTTPAVGALAIAAVVLVMVQGALGGARVLLDDRTIAKVHACTGPLFFAVAVALAMITRSRQPSESQASATPTTTWTAVGLVVACYMQLVAGAQLRHLDIGAAPATFRALIVLHVAGAVAVLVLAILASAPRTSARPWALALLLSVCCQWALGLGTWIVTLGMPTGMVPEAWRPAVPLQARSGWGAAVVTGHVVLGMLILGMSVVVAIRCGVLQRVPRFGRHGDPATQRRFA